MLRRPRDVPFYGFRLRCYPDSQSASNVIYFTPRYNPDEMDFIAAYLRPGDGFLDIGANIGTYALLARSRVGPQGWVDGFEPHPVAARPLPGERDPQRPGQRDRPPGGRGREAGRVAFVAGDDVSNRVASSSDAGRRTVEVEVVRLDEVLGGSSATPWASWTSRATRPRRCEGAARHLAAGDPPVWQLEMLDHRLRKAGTSRADLVALLAGHDYRLAEVDGRHAEAQHDPAIGSARPALGQPRGSIHPEHLGRPRRRGGRRRAAAGRPSDEPGHAGEPPAGHQRLPAQDGRDPVLPLGAVAPPAAGRGDRADHPASGRSRLGP